MRYTHKRFLPLGAVAQLFRLPFFLFASSLWLLAPASAQTNKLTLTFDGITFNSAYDNGSLAGVSRRAANDYDATLLTDIGESGTARYWFRFTMSGVAGRIVTLHLDHSQNPVPFLRVLDSRAGTWRRMTASEAPNNSTLVLSFGAGTNLVELAFFEPLGYAETLAAVTALIASDSNASTAVIGQSFEHRDLQLITVNNPRYPAAAKHRVWLHARAHAGEVTAAHTMLGFLSQILEDSETGRRLREHVIFNIVPQLNIDGIVRGHTRWDAQGLDPEAQWCNPRTPEVAALKVQVDALMATPNPISLALNLHSTMGNYTDSFFWKHLAPSVSTTFEGIEQRYIDALNAATPLFDNRSPQNSQLNACTFIESYFWNHWGESVMALTHEGHYYRRITDNAWTDGHHYSELGRAQARALISYYNLPPTTEPDLTFTLWRATRFTPAEISDPDIGSPAADPDHDGLNNAWEYIFALDPQQPDPSPVNVSRSDHTTTLTFALNQHLTDVRLSLEHSLNGTDWIQEDLATSTNLVRLTTRDVPRGTNYVDFVTVQQLTSAPQQFYRLVATAPAER